MGEQDGADHQIAGDAVSTIRRGARAFGPLQFVGDDRIEQLLDHGELLDGDAEDGVLGVAEDLRFEVGNRRFDGLFDQRLTESVPFPEPLLVLVVHDVLGRFPGQAVDFGQIGFDAVDVFLDILGAGTRDDRDGQLFDAGMHQFVDPGELADRDKAFLV